MGLHALHLVLAVSVYVAAIDGEEVQDVTCTSSLTSADTSNCLLSVGWQKVKKVVDPVFREDGLVPVPETTQKAFCHLTSAVNQSLLSKHHWEARGQDSATASEDSRPSSAAWRWNGLGNFYSILSSFTSSASWRCKEPGFAEYCTDQEAIEMEDNIPVARKCAVVSNGGVLLENKFGSEIDSADMVIRFNTAKVGGDLTTFVGKKDDIRVFSHATAEQVLNGEISFPSNVAYVLLSHKIDQAHEKVMKWARNQAESDHRRVWLGNGRVQRLAAELLEKEGLERFGGAGGRTPPSTGLLGLLVAMSRCAEVRAYGFADTTKSLAASFHYFDDSEGGSGPRGNRAGSFEEKHIWNLLSASSAAGPDVVVVPGFKRLRPCGASKDE